MRHYWPEQVQRKAVATNHALIQGAKQDDTNAIDDEPTSIWCLASIDGEYVNCDGSIINDNTMSMVNELGIRPVTVVYVDSLPEQ